MNKRGGRILPRLSDKTKSRLKKGAALAAALGYLYYTGNKPKQISPGEVAKILSEERRKQTKLSLKKKPQIPASSSEQQTQEASPQIPPASSSEQEIQEGPPQLPPASSSEPLPSYDELEGSLRPTDSEDEEFLIPPSPKQRRRKYRIKKLNNLIKKIGMEARTPPAMRENPLTVTPEQVGGEVPARKGIRRITPTMMTTPPVQGNLMKEQAKTKGLNEYGDMLEDLEYAYLDDPDPPEIDNLMTQDDLIDRSRPMNVDMRDVPIEWQTLSGQKRLGNVIENIERVYEQAMKKQKKSN